MLLPPLPQAARRCLEQPSVSNRHRKTTQNATGKPFKMLQENTQCATGKPLNVPRRNLVDDPYLSPDRLAREVWPPHVFGHPFSLCFWRTSRMTRKTDYVFTFVILPVSWLRHGGELEDQGRIILPRSLTIVHL
jgi:hypothetical protein